MVAQFLAYVELCITNAQEEVLLVKPDRRGLKFTYPSNLIDFGEHAAYAAMTTLRDFTGIESRDLTPHHAFLWNDYHHLSMHFVFKTDPIPEPIGIQLPKEFKRFKWFKSGLIKDDVSIDQFVREDFGGTSYLSREVFALSERQLGDRPNGHR